MDPATEDSAQSDVDPEMTVLTPEDFTEQNLDVSDEVETLQNSLREAVHDDNVRPKMQCLMMDSSFSMVTMQGEDSGIAWETTPSRCTTPWMSEVGIPSADLSSQATARPATPGSHPAGKIIFVMDEELISRRKKTKEKISGPKSKADRKQEVLVESSENISGRPELVEVSQPNVKTEGDQEELTDPLEDKEQQLFSLVSEGSEILNIVVPPKLATVDEEVSKEMMDNLSYLEETLVPKASEETLENELLISIELGAGTDDQVKPRPPVSLDSMDPPGAPVARMPTRGAVGNVDYFEAFALIDAQAPGGPAVTVEGQMEPETKTATEDTVRKPVQPKDTTITKHVDIDKSDTISMEELTNELLDEVFYGGTDDYFLKSPETTDGGGAVESVPYRLPSKPSGSNLFESQEDILTPIFLPEGPPKIIDPILLEEPKAMAFLYTDLYEEALGSRKKEADTESVTSEKSFHSRHSDREAQGYLEKYVLIDETPVVAVEPTDSEKCSDTQIMSQDFYDLGVFVTKPEKGEMPNSEEEITDFFRSSASSSPCDIEPFPRLLEEDDTQPTTKSKTKTERSVSITAVKAAEMPVDQLSISSFEFPSEELEWPSTDDHPTTLEERNVSVQDMWKQDSEINKPVAPPRRKVTSPPKANLDLTPLTPVDIITQENEEAGGKEQREEEKETASPAETADEGDGDGEENELAVTKTEAENMQESDEITAKPTEGRDAKTEEEERSETETVTKQTEPEIHIKSSETDQTENNAEKQEDTATVFPTEQVKNKGQCIIL